MDNQNNLLQVSEILEEKTSTDGRHYRVVRFQKVTPAGVFSNAKPRTRVLWEEGPMGSAGDALYAPIKDGRVKVGSKVLGSIETIPVNEYFIENENGKYEHPETGHPANKGDQFTGVVFEDETIEQRARNQGHTMPGELEGFQATEAETANEEINEELAV